MIKTSTSSNVDYYPFVDYEKDGIVYNVCSLCNMVHSVAGNPRDYLVKGVCTDNGKCSEEFICLSSCNCNRTDKGIDFKSNMYFNYFDNGKHSNEYEYAYKHHVRLLEQRIREVNEDLKGDN